MNRHETWRDTAARLEIERDAVREKVRGLEQQLGNAQLVLVAIACQAGGQISVNDVSLLAHPANPAWSTWRDEAASRTVYRSDCGHAALAAAGEEKHG